MNVDESFPREARRNLIDWYLAGHRQLPWRHTRDPYRILVSEVMLQQTQAERVIPKYHEFLERFPTLQALADAPAGEVIRSWSGLGYNRRALNLQRTARAVLERYGGRMPSDPVELLTLPGIGPYTAGAIACFAFGQDVAFVDTNIRRVIHRVVAGPELPEQRLNSRQIDNISRVLVPEGDGYVWNQALMELGATVCRAKSTDCELCPLRRVCAARSAMQDVRASRPRGTAKTPKFETTSRYVRGRIVAALRHAPAAGLSLDELGEAIPIGAESAPTGVMQGYVDGLVRDGLIVPAVPTPRGIEEPAPLYDAGSPDLTTRYRLPD